MKNLLIKGRAVFLFLLIVFSVHLSMLAALGWKGWALYAVVVAAAIASCYVSDGGCTRDLVRLASALHPRLGRLLAVLVGERRGRRAVRHGKKRRRSPRKG
ncbi:hypothetical protein HAQ00_11695 [Acidithiobacillus caldus ATCC 51756]|jgi:hypothetical protein|uniref:hypothetical protein n=1 Tax=Acidithiobacillus caldus TaxID=33059 RepID=UPI001C075AD4|nr:hypothetical protein [Acidithiobacillus caldus]MBU2736365.1 hypothetical protein [Acidithiobacillus caldus ATCC 51756]MBU2801023.1 hypothetical protein [Acidithiobacillus caldus]